jgi:hypothetical protein
MARESIVLFVAAWTERSVPMFSPHALIETTEEIVEILRPLREALGNHSEHQVLGAIRD